MEVTSGSDQPGLQGAPATSLPTRSFGQIRGFDGLRGIAVLIVFVAHMDVILPIPTLLVIPGATVSLDSFFVLSGFLITALLLREQAAREDRDRAILPAQSPQTIARALCRCGCKCNIRLGDSSMDAH